jgi:hypothetical protein
MRYIEKASHPGLKGVLSMRPYFLKERPGKPWFTLNIPTAQRTVMQKPLAERVRLSESMSHFIYFLSDLLQSL